MNIHPLFVHFPIALLVVYSIMELIHTQRFNHSDTYASIKGFLVIVGTLAAYVTVSTGEIAEGILSAGGPELARLVETHSTFAGVSTAIFSLLAASYAVKFILDSRYADVPVVNAGPFAPIWHALCVASRGVRESVFGQFLALAGIICITITGALGAAIVYGPDVDPIVSAVYRLFF